MNTFFKDLDAQTPCFCLLTFSYLLEFSSHWAGCWAATWHCTAWLHVDEDSIPTHSSSDTSSNLLMRREEWGEICERFTSRQRWFPSEAAGKVSGWRQIRGREFRGESLSVWSMIFLHSEKRFSILLLSSQQSHRGKFSQNTYLSLLSLMSWQKETRPWFKSPTKFHFQLEGEKVLPGHYTEVNSRSRGDMWLRILRWGMQKDLTTIHNLTDLLETKGTNELGEL